MKKQSVIFRDLGQMNYKAAWDYQESLLQKNVNVKSKVSSSEELIANEPTHHSPLTTTPNGRLSIISFLSSILLCSLLAKAEISITFCSARKD